MRAIISNEITIYEPTQEVLSYCQNQLMLVNPLYEQLMRLGKEDQVRRCHVPKDMALYSKGFGYVTVPFGCLNAIWKYIKDYPFETRFNDNGTVMPRSLVISKPLYDYQQDAADAMLRNKGGVLIGGCGSGKTNIGVHVSYKIGKRTLWLCHTSDLLRQSVNRIHELYPDLEVGTITDGEVNIGRDITVATIQTMAKIDPEIYKNTFDVVITDECFPAGTKISTKDGYKNIEDIKEGDYVLSYNHKTNKTEYKKVTHLFVKTSSHLHSIKYNDKILVGTNNHPIYTQRGYVPMEDIRNGDYVLQSLWKTSNKTRCQRINMEQIEKEGFYLLQSRMCDEREKEANLDTRNETKNVCVNDSQELSSSRIQKKTSKDEDRQSDGSRRDSLKNDANQRNERDFTSTNKRTRWQREDCSSSADAQRCFDQSWRRDNNGISSENSSSSFNEAHLSNLLQSRYSDSVQNDSNRSGWREPQWETSKEKRCEEERVLVWARVEGVSIQEQSDFEGCTSSCTVYNLEVEDNNNYFANDILVHNCHHVASSPTLMKQFGTVINRIAARYKFGLTASEKRNDSLTKSIYAYIGANLKGELLPTYKIAREDANTLTAKHVRFNLDTKMYQVDALGQIHYPFLNTDGTFNYANLIDFLSTDKQRNLAICDNIEKYKDRKQLVLCARIKHCELIYNELIYRGIKAVLLVGKVTDKKRKQILSGETPWTCIVASTSLAKEGLDVPELSVLHLASPISNKSDTVQSVGRIERVCPNKVDPICFDYVDNNPYCISRFNKRAGWLKRRY